MLVDQYALEGDRNTHRNNGSLQEGVGLGIGGAKAIANSSRGTTTTTNTTQSGGDDGGSSYNAQDEWASWWKDMQKYLKTLYEKEVRNNRENFESSRDQINLNRARNDRIFRAMSDPDSGRGMSIRARNNSNWINNLATARNTLANANDTSLANYHQNLANARSNYINQYMALMNSHHH